MAVPRSSGIFGVGINDVATPMKKNKKILTHYSVWRGMLGRCYDSKWHARFPTYVGCTVDPCWHRLSVFKAWYDEHYRPGFDLDKDILVPGNKVYGPDTCVFVPQRLNKLLTDHRGARGDLPLGVSRNGRGYIGWCSDGTGKQRGKTFPTVWQAEAWYRATKSKVIRRAATDALARREIDIDVHKALLKHAALYEAGRH